MARPNKTGVPGLARTGDGRFRLDFRFVRPDGRPGRETRLYPVAWTATMIKTDARRRVGEAISGADVKREQAAALVAGRKTIAALAPDVIAHRKAAGGSPATLVEFESILDSRIVPGLGKLAPHELTSAELAAFLDGLAKLSPLSVRNTIKVLGAFVRIVRVRGLDPALRTNPVRDAFELGLSLPATKRKAPIFLSLPEARRLVAGKVAPEVARKKRTKHAAPVAPVPPERRVRYALAFLTGLRDGELAGLTWGDVGGEVVRVRHAVALVGNGKPGPLKTEAAKRDLPKHPAIARYLDTWRAAWSERFERKPTPVDPLFPSPQRGVEGLRHYRPPSARHLAADLAIVGIDRPELTFHATRRSFASWLEAAGVPHETIERLVGHEPRSVLGRHYAATSIDVLREAIGRIAWARGGG